MRKISVFITCLFITVQLFSQKKTFDIATYQPPKNWKVITAKDIMTYSVDDKKGSWCLLSVYRSTASKGSVDEDFNNEWKELVADTYEVTGAPEIGETQEADGWSVKFGSGQFVLNSKPAAVMLTVMSGYGRCVSVVASTANEKYLKTIQDFLATIDLKKPAVNNPVSQPVQNNTGYAYTRTNFNDGWVSTIYDDYVLAEKNGIRVYLSYVEKFNESDYSGTGKQKRFHYWDNYVAKYFTTGEKKFDSRGVLSDYSQDFIEAWGTDKQTGEKRYLAMIVRVIAYTGTLSIVFVSAPDDQQLRKQFPKADLLFDNDLLPMYGYNKFAVGKKDLTGTWVSGNNGLTASWYSTTTGNNVGATAATSSDKFTFRGDGSYSSEHKGATGWVGALNTYQQKYNGAYTVTDWNVTATKRFNGKTDKYDAWFEIVKGGRVLHLDEGAMTMTLGKMK